MNRQEQMQFIDRELKGLWPQWQPTEAEVRVWMSDLAALDYAVARTAAQACFREQAANYHRPVLGKFLDKARAFSRSSAGPSRREPRDPTTTVFIECLEPPQDHPHLAGVRKPVYVRPASRQTDPDYVLACAEHMRTQFERLYGGHWITIVTKPGPDGGLGGEPARCKAYDGLLGGPDTPGRRHLQSLLARRAESAEHASHTIPSDERCAMHARQDAPSAELIPVAKPLGTASRSADWLDNVPISLRSPAATGSPQARHGFTVRS